MYQEVSEPGFKPRSDTKTHYSLPLCCCHFSPDLFLSMVSNHRKKEQIPPSFLYPSIPLSNKYLLNI